MKVSKSVIYYNKLKTFTTRRDKNAVHALQEGFGRHGYNFKVVFGSLPNDEPFHEIVLTSGWNRHPGAAGLGENHLIIDCGYLGDRSVSCLSLGWFGLNGQAKRQNPIHDRGQKWFQQCLPWVTPNQVVLLLGQVSTDKALTGVHIGYREWLQKVADQLSECGYRVLFKPHPRRRGFEGPMNAQRIDEPLDEAITKYKPSFGIAYSSNALVECAVRGVYPVPLSTIAMTWDVRTKFDLKANAADRKNWLDYVTSQQWTLEEIKSGDAWDHLRQGVGL